MEGPTLCYISGINGLWFIPAGMGSYETGLLFCLFFFLAIFLNPVTVQVALVVTGKGLSSPLTPPIPLDWMVRLLESGLMGTSALWVYEPLLPVKVPLTSPCLDQWFSKSVIQGHFCMTENSLKHLSPALSHLTYRGRKESPVWPWMRWHNEAILNGM